MKKILIIEDDNNIALALSVRLKSHGYTTWSACDGLLGLKLAVRHKPDLIVLDISLPGGNGFELAERLQTLPETHDTPIIFATGSKDPDLRKKAITAGAAGLLRKPYDPEELVRMVQSVLEVQIFHSDRDPSPSPSSASKMPPKRILIIEDDSPTATALKVRLDANGYVTSVASDGIIGFGLAMRERPDLILLDIGIPGGDGFDLASKLRRQPQSCHLPIIFITASKDPELRQKVMHAGAAGLLEKPIDPEELLLMTKLAFGRPARIPSDGLPLSPRLPGQGGSQLTVKHILIIEDDPNIARSLSVRLQAAGYETSLASDGLSGVHSAVRHRPDLVLLDISLPAGDGFSVAERIQTNIPTPTSIIFLTASKRPEFRKRANDLGAVAFFEKPFEAQDLLATIRKSLAQSGQISAQGR
jgi:DNA-binding response OmpR family regulator